ncbi:hypothetical protein [Paramicrobacterium agarici]|uniref:hypothetical protein n=1 Tax=Paramicrobacterium agarici TaxID=630514 RepID=UPI00114E9077|nr:hypothetical protein [Microbacterium agarici]TQO24180.1 hypothetical protein FB385_3056 [Microbacterium agarici]
MTLVSPAASRSALTSCVIVIVVSIAIAVWVGFGRVILGWPGTVGMVLSLTVVPIGLVLHGSAALQMRNAVRRGSSIRRAVIAFVLAASSGVLFGATVPEITNEGIRSLMAPTGETWAVEMTIALCNPLGIVYLATSIATVVFARLAARGASEPGVDAHEVGVG